MSESGNTIQFDLESIRDIPEVQSILEVVCRTTGMGFAAVAHVTDDRWVACAVRDSIDFGLEPGGELRPTDTFCYQIKETGELMVIDCVAKDEQFSTHFIPRHYGFQSYISVPIILKTGAFFGTLCALDPMPAQVNSPEVIAMFKLFADLIAFHLDAMAQLALAESNLLEERRTAELREQFIAILGHDLRSPVSAVNGSAQLLRRSVLDEQSLRLVNIIQDACSRITGLIENMLDFASGRLGGGIALSLKAESAIETMLNEIITELAVAWPDRAINTDFNLNGAVYCDSKRIAQLFSNLLGNALKYGSADDPVRVRAVSKDGHFTLSVSNAGKKIADSVKERLFQPFSRGDIEPDQKGLGLGLYIAAEIARAHKAMLDVVSTSKETCFTFSLPGVLANT